MRTSSPAAYKHARILTSTTIVRSATDWVLVEVERVSASRAVKYRLPPTFFAAAAASPWATRRNCVPLNLSDLFSGRRTVSAILLVSLGVSEAEVTQ